MHLREAMGSAWTTRYYSAEPVELGKLQRILDAARFAPSRANRQGWRGIALLDPLRRQAIGDLYRERRALHCEFAAPERLEGEALRP